MKKRWKVSPVNKTLRDVLVKGLNIRPLTAQLLINRGLVDCDRASSFLKPGLDGLHDPFLLKGMKRAAGRVAEAVRKGERIAVYGDYDVDGMTATALLRLFFAEVGVDVTCYIPCRSEGYGLNAGAVKMLHASGVKVIITTDCGITNHEEITLAHSLGVDVIVTDHHEPAAVLPPALAVVNPKQKGCAFPFKGLAGVGVAFNFIMALRAELRRDGFLKGPEPNLKKYLGLVAIGTVSDMVPLVDENRVFVRFGLRELDRREMPGLKALVDVARIKPGPLNTYHIAFQIAPRLNAAGRISKAQSALELLITEDEGKAASLARSLDETNAQRKGLETDIFNEAVKMLEGASDERGIVLFSERWHPGVIGIVASRLVERFSRPAVMIAVEGDIARGSARGIRSFNVLDGLKACGGYLEKYGGHKAAAGLTVRKDNLEPFKKEFLAYISGVLTDEDLVPEVEIDASVSLVDVDLGLISEIEALAPFGVSNREPLLCIPDACIVSTSVVGGRHLRLRLRQNGLVSGGIGFGLAGLHPMEGSGFAVAFSPYIDDWGGVRRPRLKIKDLQQGVNFLT